LKKLKKLPAQAIVAGIYGKPNGILAVPDEKIELAKGYATPRLADVCGGKGIEGTGATPAVRMNALLAEFGGRASQSSICETELSWALRDVGLITRHVATRNRCLRGALIDRDPAPGLQPACRVEAVREVTGERATGTEIPRCDGSSTRCFSLETDLSCESQLAFRVSHDTTDETLRVTCDVDVDAIGVIGTER
jgi:hypothetical protein